MLPMERQILYKQSFFWKTIDSSKLGVGGFLRTEDILKRFIGVRDMGVFIGSAIDSDYRNMRHVFQIATAQNLRIGIETARFEDNGSLPNTPLEISHGSEHLLLRRRGVSTGLIIKPAERYAYVVTTEGEVTERNLDLTFAKSWIDELLKES